VNERLRKIEEKESRLRQPLSDEKWIEYRTFLQAEILYGKLYSDREEQWAIEGGLGELNECYRKPVEAKMKKTYGNIMSPILQKDTTEWNKDEHEAVLRWIDMRERTLTQIHIRPTSEMHLHRHQSALHQVISGSREPSRVSWKARRG
jgi:hypothetical protein